MALQELIYTSLAIPNASHENVEDILAASQRNNTQYDVTGLLLFDGDRYIQILEGSAENIDKIYDAIAKDKRHHGVELIHRGEIEGRAFTDWRMAYEALPVGLLGELAEKMSVYAMEVTGEIILPGESFGTRLDALFMDALAAE